MRRTLALFAVLLPACPIDGRPDDLTTIVTAGITVSGFESSTGDPEGDGPRLDLGDAPPLPDLPAEGTSTGSTGAAGTSGEAPGSTGELAGNTSTGEAGSSSSTGGSSSTGEPEPEPEPEPPSVCGDGVCEPTERSPCWGWDGGWSDGFCAEDCMSDPACVAVLDCPCSPEAAAVKSWCFAEPLPACGATAPGGACSVSTALAFFMWNAKCGG